MEHQRAPLKVGARFEVLVPGLQTTVQDLGRWGHQAQGVPVAGPMDPFAHRLANALIGNPREAATLEITLVGPELRFGDDRLIAVSGAQFGLTVDNAPIGHETAVRVRAGSILRFGARVNGARAYLAIEGGINVPVVLGSRSTHLPSATGGWHGRALQKGDVLPLGPSRPGAEPPQPLASVATPEVLPGSDAIDARPVVVRVLPGPQDDQFVDTALTQLTSQPYRVGIDSNRMGYRLEGPVVAHASGPDIVPDATPVGTLQVPGSGQPVLLMADRQTTGGYAKLATIISADIGVVAQVTPGQRIAFQVVTTATATAALIARERRLLALEPDPSDE